MNRSNYDLSSTMHRNRQFYVGRCRDCGTASEPLMNPGCVQSWAGTHAEQVHGVVWPEMLLAGLR